MVSKITQEPELAADFIRHLIELQSNNDPLLLPLNTQGQDDCAGTGVDDLSRRAEAAQIRHRMRGFGDPEIGPRAILCVD